jgi:hypothetical protein
MEFWIGLSVGMHLGRVLAGYLEKFGIAYGLLSEQSQKELTEVGMATSEITALIEEVAED